MPEYPRSHFKKTGTSITPNVDGDSLDATVIGRTTPAAGSFTTLTAATDPTDENGVGDRDFNDARYALESNNLSDLDSAATAFGNIKQAATESSTGVLEKATTGEVVTGTDTDRAVTPAGITARMGAPGGIGETTPNTGNFTTLDISGQLQGDLISNQMVQKATFDILGLMTDPRFLNLQCEDPGAGTMTDVSGQGHNGIYQGSMTHGDRIKGGMGWLIDLDGIDDCIILGDHDDFSFGNSTNDEAVTFFGMIEIVSNGINQRLISKYDNSTGVEKREYVLSVDENEHLRLSLYDESANVGCSRFTDGVISDGNHTFIITYSGAGGATAANGIIIYIDGVLASSTPSNNASYVAMENITTSCRIGCFEGSVGTLDGFFLGDIGCIGIDGSEWSEFDAHRFHQLCKGLYGL